MDVHKQIFPHFKWLIQEDFAYKWKLDSGEASWNATGVLKGKSNQYKFTKINSILPSKVHLVC